MKRTLPAVFNFALGDFNFARRDFALALCAALSVSAATARAQDSRTARAPRASQSSTTAPRAPQPSSTTTRARDAAREQQQPGPTSGESGAEPDLSITAHVTADSLRFEKVPNPTVEFTGRPRRETVWHADRENLPQEVRPGVTYRNVGITLA